MIKRVFIYNMCLIALTAVVLGLFNSEQNDMASQKNIQILSSYGRESTLSGNYLAGRFAQHVQDWKSAQYYMNNVVKRDDKNEFLKERAFLLSIGAGKFDKAKNLAKNFINSDTNMKELAIILLTCDAIKNSEFEQALNYIEKIPDSGLGQYAKPLLKTWSLAGLNKFDEALSVLKKDTSESDPTYHLHAGLLAEFRNNNKEAAEHYKLVMANGLELHSAIIIANFFERYGKSDISKEIYNNLDAMYPYKPFTRSNKEAKNFTNITSPAKGASLAVYDLTSILYNNRAYDSANIYGNIVQMLDKDSDFTKIMLGDIAAIYDHNEEALNIYGSVEKGSPVFWLAQTRISEVYELEGNINKSIDILKNMAKDTTIKSQVMVSLGDIYSQNNDYAKAVNAYDEALSGVGEIKEEHWAVLYARGVAKEKTSTWESAEKDLLTALKMQPHNPSILNFIAYSWAEKGINLEQALSYAEHAVKIKPYDGAIVDSYGWVLFRMQRYKEAVKVLENAVELMPDDSIIIDHLGDAYWKTGLKNEARSMWHKAATSSNDMTFKKISFDKIAHGIITEGDLETQKAGLEK